MKNKILFILPHLDLGGGARRIKTYCDYLDKKKFEVVVCVYSKNVTRDIKAVIGKDTKFLKSDSLEEIKKFISKENISAAYTYYDGQYNKKLFEILSFLKQKNVKLIGNNVFSYYNPEMDRLFDLIVFQTKMMLIIKFKNNLPDLVDPDFKRYKILYNPVNTSFFNEFKISKKERIKLRKELGINVNDLVVGRFGRNDIVKWGDILFVVMLKVMNYRNIKFLIVGIPKSRKIMLKSLFLILPSIKSKIIIIEPMQDDKRLMQLMQITDVIGHSVNIGEGCSNAINEAMYWSKPVITNSTPHCDNGQVEQVDNLTTGIIANNVSDFKNAILRLSKDEKLRNRLGTNGHKKVIKYYESRKIVKEFEYLLGLVLNLDTKSSMISVTEKEIKEFSVWYKRNLNSLLNPKTGVLEKLFSYPVRGLNFIEYKYFNG